MILHESWKTHWLGACNQGAAGAVYARFLQRAFMRVCRIRG